MRSINKIINLKTKLLGVSNMHVMHVNPLQI